MGKNITKQHPLKFYRNKNALVVRLNAIYADPLPFNRGRPQKQTNMVKGDNYTS